MMDGVSLQMTAIDAMRGLWAAAFGACVGSLINVLAYRIPRGMDYVTPTSRCPSCSTKLTWRENIPIFGWLMLRGKCRFCRSPISPEYPIVESIVALLWFVAFMVCYADEYAGLSFFLHLQPEWARSGFVQTWPIFLVIVTLLSSLVAMTIVDAKTYTIPEQLTNFPTIVGLVVNPLAAIWVQHKYGQLTHAAPGYSWSLWTPDHFGWWWVGAALGGAVGWGIANLLLWKKILKRTFGEEYVAWETEAIQKIEAAQAEREAKIAAGEQVAEEDDPTQQQLWIKYPHARREMAREALFVGVILACALIGGMIAYKAVGPWAYNPNTLVEEPMNDAARVPLWLMVLSGSLLGYLIAGGFVWFCRIIATLAFGKEALGIGDVHMMAAVGTCIGWIDPVIAFFLAAFLGMFGWIIQLLTSGENKRLLPYGPFLAMATVLVWFGKPVVEWVATKLWQGGVNWP